MILFFSGTGNSRYTAELIGSVIGEKPVSLNDIIKSGAAPSFNSESPYIIVCPTYAWRIPRIVEKTIKKADFSGSRDIYFVLTCGDGDGNAYAYAKKLCEETGMTFKGLKSVVMPENYIVLFNAPADHEAKKIIEKARPEILSIAETIRSGGELTESTKALGKILSSAVNSVFYPVFVSAKGFYATDECVSCGKCAELCPLNNITLKDGKPVWGADCTHCMACICRCPEKAIEYKNKTKGKPRYSI